MYKIYGKEYPSFKSALKVARERSIERNGPVDIYYGKEWAGQVFSNPAGRGYRVIYMPSGRIASELTGMTYPPDNLKFKVDQEGKLTRVVKKTKEWRPFGL